MAELTLEYFQQFEKQVFKRFDKHDERFTEHDKRFDEQDEILAWVKTTIDGLAEKIEEIDNGLWSGERLTEHERRIRLLAERTGQADLATPITRPL